MKHVQLHNHSRYSLLDGVPTVEDLVNRAATFESPAIALTDHGNILGEYDLYFATQKTSVKPILGTEAYLINPIMHQVATKQVFDQDLLLASPAYSFFQTLFLKKDYRRSHHHILLLAVNQTGVRNIHRLSTASHKHLYYKPSLTHALLEQYSDGIVATSGCLAAEIPTLIREGMIREAEELLGWYSQVFRGRFFIELQYHEIPELDNQINPVLIYLAKKHHLPLIVTSDIHYILPEDKSIQDTLLKIGTQKKKKDGDEVGDVFSIQGEGYWYRSPEEMYQYLLQKLASHKCYDGRGWIEWDGVEQRQSLAHEMIQTTVDLAGEVNYERTVPSGFQMPEIMPDLTEQQKEQKLREMVYRGACELFGCEGQSLPDEVQQRLEEELGIIARMGQVDYFLILNDLIDYLKSENILYNIRGSGGGSLVLYCLKISHTNPLRHSLLFERFLNPDRVTMPDVDIDVVDTQRKKVVGYLLKKYGDNKVARIMSFQVLKLKASINEACRQANVSPTNIRLLSKYVNNAWTTIDELESDPAYMEQLKKFREKDAIMNTARQIAGRIRTLSIHPAGILITPKPIDEYTGLHHLTRVDSDSIDTTSVPELLSADNEEGADAPDNDNPDEVLPAQMDMGIAEKAGLVKFDLLGVRTLTIIDETLRLIKQRYGKDIRWSDIPCEYNEAYEIYHKGDTVGIFQVSGEVMREIFKRLKPNSLDQIVGVISLYRPGSMDFIDSYIKRARGEEEVQYPHPLLESILRETFGIIIYQEQVIHLLKMVGFSGGEADNVRRAISKKKHTEIEKARPKFIDGCFALGIPPEKAQEIWEMIEKFANYGFNKSHGASYAEVSARTAWLKHHYRKEYLLSCMNCEYIHNEKLMEYIGDARKSGIKILPPHINRSEALFTIEGDNIRYGLLGLKGIKQEAVQKILQARQGGDFESFTDFWRRAGQFIDAATINVLLLSGALDCLISTNNPNGNSPRFDLYQLLPEKNKKSLKTYLAKATLNEMATIEGKDKDQDKAFIDNFAILPDRVFWMRGEFSVIGKTYVSDHPLMLFLSSKKEFLPKPITFPDYASNFPINEPVWVLGIIDEILDLSAKKQIFINILGFSFPTLRVAMFSDFYDKFRPRINRNHIALFKINRTKSGYYNIREVVSYGHIYEMTTYN